MSTLCCKRCGEPESSIHLFFHYPYTQQVWRDAPLAIGFDPRGIVDLEARWTSLCTTPCLPPTGVVTSHLFPWILWALWKERNNFVFNGASAAPAACLTAAILAAKEWEQALSSGKKPPTKGDPSSTSPASRLYFYCTNRRSMAQGR